MMPESVRIRCLLFVALLLESVLCLTFVSSNKVDYHLIYEQNLVSRSVLSVFCSTATKQSVFLTLQSKWFKCEISL